MTSALHAEGPGFDPRPEYPQHLFDPGGEDLERVRFPGARLLGYTSGASIAQMVERKTLNLVVVGSIPTGGAFLLPQAAARCGRRSAAGVPRSVKRPL